MTGTPYPTTTPDALSEYRGTGPESYDEETLEVIPVEESPFPDTRDEAHVGMPRYHVIDERGEQWPTDDEDFGLEDLPPEVAGPLLRRWRKARDLSQREAAERINSSQRTWQSWELADRDMPAWIGHLLRDIDQSSGGGLGR